MKINEVAKLTGVTVRTLHYYDEIGLLPPSEITEAGYRIYHEDALSTLQQILFFRELDFPLSDIKRIMTDPHYQKSEALTAQRELLLQKRSRLDGLISLLDCALKGEKNMSFQEFDLSKIEETTQKYAAEAKERWGGTDAYQESEQKTASYDKATWSMIHGQGAELLTAFAELRNTPPDSEEAQRLVAHWQEYITQSFYHCTDEILSCLGAMYVGDERFTQNIDEHGAGTAAFMAAAIDVYCKK